MIDQDFEASNGQDHLIVQIKVVLQNSINKRL